MIKQNHTNHSDRNRRIGNIEYRTEKLEPLTSYPRYPIGPIKTEQREIEHIHNSPIEQPGIPVSRHKRSDQRGDRIVKHQSIEQAVYNISRSSRYNQSQANDESRSDLGTILNFQHPPRQKNNGNNTEQRQEQLASHFHAEGHTVIFDKRYIKPIGHSYRFTDIHVSFHPYLHGLVDNEYKNNRNKSNLPFGQFLHIQNDPHPGIHEPDP